MKKSIRTFNKIAQKGLSLFDPSQFSVSDSEENPSAIVLRSHNLHELSFNSDLQCIGRAGAGVNNIPVEACTEKGGVVFNAPGANANAVKELVFTGMLLSSRDVVGGINFAKTVQDNGTAFSKQIESNKSRFAGEEIKGKTLGVIGLGAIGLLVANSAVHLGLKVQGYDPFLSVNRAWELSNAVKPAKSLEKLLAESDFISIHVPYSEKTKQFFDDKRLSLFKKGSVLLNFSREGLVDHDAVTEALDKGMLSKYVTDFPS